MLVSSTSSVSAVVGTDTVPVVAQQEQLPSSVCRNPALPPVPLVNTKVYSIYCRRVACKVNTTSDPSVAEAGVIVATVGALLLSIMVPVAEAVPLHAKVSSTSSIVSAVGTDTVPVVAAGTLRSRL
jgi:hypothetical protein